MSQAAWPTYTEVGAIMVSAGLASAAPTEAELSPYIDAAVGAWERKTGYKPWLSGASASYYYDGPPFGSVLDLQGGFISVSAVRIYITSDDDTGTLLTVNEDYILQPMGAQDRDEPFTEILFLTALSRNPRSIKITGVKGYDNEIADEVWLAVAREAARLAVEDLTSSGGDVEEIKQGPVTIKYASSAEGGSVLSKWGDGFCNLAKRYRRMVV